MKKKLLLLVRHCKMKFNIDQQGQRTYVGQIDLPLSDEGIKQARKLGRSLSQESIDAIYCSDLKRSVATAREIDSYHGKGINMRADLREINMGDWEGLTFPEVAKKYPKEFRQRGSDIAYFQPPGGESFAQCSKRAVGALQEIVESEASNIVIVGHAGLNRVLICHILGMPLANLFRISQDYGCLNAIYYGDFGYRIKHINAQICDEG